MKKVLILIVLIFTVSLFPGCTTGSYTSVGSVQVNTLSSMSMSYHKFSGNRSTRIHVDEGKPVEVKVDIVTSAGKINLSIIDGEKKPVYEGTDIPTSDFTVKLDKAGDYTVTLTGKDHKGKYKISWGDTGEKE